MQKLNIENEHFTSYWYQPADREEADVVVVNGSRLDDGPKRANMFEVIYNLANQVLDYKSPWAGFVGQYFFAKGFLIDRGKNTSFLYIAKKCEGKKKTDYVSQMKEEIETEDLVFDTTTLEYLDHHTIPKLVIWTLLSFVLLITISIIVIYLTKK